MMSSPPSIQLFAPFNASFSFLLRASLRSLGFTKPFEAFITCLQMQGKHIDTKNLRHYCTPRNTFCWTKGTNTIMAFHDCLNI